MCTSNKEITSRQSNSDIILRKAREYYEKNKEKRKEYQRNRCAKMTQEQKNKQVEYRKVWHNRQSKEKQVEIREKAKDYSKNRYHNHIIVVSYIY